MFLKINKNNAYYHRKIVMRSRLIKNFCDNMLKFYKKKVKNKNIYNAILNLIYPPKCGICGKFNQNFLCNKCKNNLNNQAEFRIEKNQKQIRNYEEHIYIFKYEGIIRKKILDYKFKEQAYLYKTFVNFLLKNEKIFEKIKTYDTIIPVPISKKRKKERGYNQSYLISREIAIQTKLECINNCLYKTKNIIEQSKLNKEERQKNIEGVYELKNSKKIENKKVILIDDIYTTGSTVNECCKTLKKAEVKKIGILTLAKD